MGYKRQTVRINVSGLGLGADPKLNDLAERLYRVDHDDLAIAADSHDETVVTFSVPAAVTLPADEYGEMVRRRMLAALSDWRIDAVVVVSVENGRLQCDMQEGCSQTVTHIDSKGWVYCAPHAETRKASVRCRKLKTGEVKTLEKGEPISAY